GPRRGAPRTSGGPVRQGGQGLQLEHKGHQGRHRGERQELAQPDEPGRQARRQAHHQGRGGGRRGRRRSAGRARLSGRAL
ncbi:MAG: Phosphotransferase system, phosphocarrier protein HPr, partial [uncultured Rubrobacteraceae bacterium]